jgi:hypothetical protein
MIYPNELGYLWEDLYKLKKNLSELHNVYLEYIFIKNDLNLSSLKYKSYEDEFLKQQNL